MRLLAASCAAALTALAGSPVLAQPYAPPSYGAPPYQPYAPPPPGYPATARAKRRERAAAELRGPAWPGSADTADPAGLRVAALHSVSRLRSTPKLCAAAAGLCRARPGLRAAANLCSLGPGGRRASQAMSQASGRPIHIRPMRATSRNPAATRASRRGCPPWGSAATARRCNTCKRRAERLPPGAQARRSRHWRWRRPGCSTARSPMARRMPPVPARRWRKSRMPCTPSPMAIGRAPCRSSTPPSRRSPRPDSSAAPREHSRRQGCLWIGSTQYTDSGCSTGAISRLTTTASLSLRTSTHSKVSSLLALIS